MYEWHRLGNELVVWFSGFWKITTLLARPESVFTPGSIDKEAKLQDVIALVSGHKTHSTCFPADCGIYRGPGNWGAAGSAPRRMAVLFGHDDATFIGGTTAGNDVDVRRRRQRAAATAASSTMRKIPQLLDGHMRGFRLHKVNGGIQSRCILLHCGSRWVRRRPAADKRSLGEEKARRCYSTQLVLAIGNAYDSFHM